MEAPNLFGQLLAEAPEPLLERLQAGQKINRYVTASGAHHLVSIGPVIDSLTIASTPSEELADWLVGCLRCITRRARPLTPAQFRQVMLVQYLDARTGHPRADLETLVDDAMAALVALRSAQVGEGEFDWSEEFATTYADGLLNQRNMN